MLNLLPQGGSHGRANCIDKKTSNLWQKKPKRDFV